jgi:predicted ATPase
VLSKELAADPTAETTALFEAIQHGNLPALKTAHLLPEPPTSFVGRGRELDEIVERLADPDCRLVTILGMGGIGKSRIALQVALAHSGLYRDGIFWVSLASAIEVPSTIVAALGYTAPDSASRLLDLLREKETLLVLDNFEHLVDSSDILSELLAAAPGLQLIVTSRERLRLREEWVYILEGLSYPMERDEDGSQAFDALALFANRATQIDSHFALTETCLAESSAICRLVEGHPLAIELAASGVAERSCGEIAASLRQNMDALSPTLRNFPVRHRSLRAVFEHSWNLLTADDRPSLAKLSVFDGGFTREAALAVAETSEKQLAGLAAKSFLRRDNDGRYALHETIRQFASEKLKNAIATQQRHAEYYANWAANSDGVVSASKLDLLQTERANFRAAWAWARQAQVDLLKSLLAGLSLLYALRGPLSEGESLFRETLQSLDGEISQKGLAAEISIELARIYNAQTRHNEAIELAQTVTGEPLLQARALLTWGQALDAQGECEAARPVLEQSLALARSLGDKRIEADSLRELGNAANRLVEYDIAMPLYAQSLTLARELGDKRGESATLNNWGALEWDLGELEAAKAHYLGALALYRELGNLHGEAKALNNLSNVAADQGDLSAALQYSEQALGIHREMGNPRGQSAALNNLGATYYSLGQYNAARKRYQQALVFYRDSGNYQAEAETLANLSLLDCVQGLLAAGCENAQKAVALAEKAGDKINHANALYYLGRNQLAAGNYEAAESALHRAIDLRREIPHPGRQAEIQAELALLAQKRSRFILALELLAPVLEILHDPCMLNGTDDPYRIYQIAAQILAKNGHSMAVSMKEMGKTLVKARAEKIGDAILRQSFLSVHDFFA